MTLLGAAVCNALSVSSKGKIAIRRTAPIAPNSQMISQAQAALGEFIVLPNGTGEIFDRIDLKRAN